MWEDGGADKTLAISTQDMQRTHSGCTQDPRGVSQKTCPGQEVSKDFDMGGVIVPAAFRALPGY